MSFPTNPHADRSVSLHTSRIDIRPTVRASATGPGGPRVIVDLGPDALLLDPASAADLVEGLVEALAELSMDRDAVDAAGAIAVERGFVQEGPGEFVHPDGRRVSWAATSGIPELPLRLSDGTITDWGDLPDVVDQLTRSGDPVAS